MTLPQFLLAYIQSRWVWLGFRPPIPAPTARWSFLRVLAFTAGQIVVGMVLGAVLSLIVYQQIVSWPVWLLGSFSALQGLIGYGLTALCWNQRAARLRADPTLKTGLRPIRFHIFRWMIGLVYFFIVALVTPAIVWVTMENARGELLWRHERANLIARGEKLNYRDILGPAIPPDQNAGAAQVFAPFFDYTYEPDPKLPRVRHLVWRDTNALNRIEDSVKSPNEFMPRKSESPSTPGEHLPELAEAYEKAVHAERDRPSWASLVKLPDTTNDPARVVLAGLAIGDNTLAQICDASTRARAQFPVHYEDGFEALLRHLSFLKGASQMLAARCAARLAVGDTSGAFADAECALRMSDLLREEPFLISQLVRYAQSSLAVRTLWQGLAAHSWDDAQLAQLQKDLLKINFLPGLESAFEGERACGLFFIDSSIAKPGAMSDAVGPTESGVPGQFPARILSRGMLRENEITMARYQTRMLEVIRSGISNAPQTGLAEVAAAAADESAAQAQLTNSYSPYQIMAAMLSPALGGVVAKTVRMQTMVRMAEVACALERYHLKHGAFPTQLDELVPAYLPEAPRDPMNNQPFHYHLTDDGWFQLYSVGLNGRDDGGVLKTSTKDREELDWPWPVPSRPERFRLF